MGTHLWVIRCSSKLGLLATFSTFGFLTGGVFGIIADTDIRYTVTYIRNEDNGSIDSL